ncbi:uncharacterized protein Z518_04584 [Rhinocladiella mackenziei CBS 650.93]|uniref:Ubiquitin-like domain-containing protein n=1 Tax=Rhinocladiella mackenziei CBS 650.93 TaxID=1442369 RepID=A0A0D2H859_9EURO|nr:uncharacterized protein Z518_04584 [Rhinocladiella mackenziei CBS 650.93]KIX06608.1 hypothetical protein Z518_04584 [Rhinocladiella mackenziei CBS 650.93]
MKQALATLVRQLARIEYCWPPQIDCPMVRLRDLFGVLKPIPYDLTSQWEDFKTLLALIFRGRKGLHRIEMGQYFILHIRRGVKLDSAFWGKAIRPGDDLSMTIGFDELEAEEDICPFRSCQASPKDVPIEQGGKFCPRCVGFSVVSESASNRNEVSMESRAKDGPSRFQNMSDLSSCPKPGSAATEFHKAQAEDIEEYCFVQVMMLQTIKF